MIRTSTGRFPHAADGTDHAFLNRAEQLYLYVVRQVADLVEENGSAFRRLEDALFVRNGRRKGSFGMSEQLAGGQLAREHAAVDGDERTGLPLAVGVDEAGRVFLAVPLSPVIRTDMLVGATSNR